MSRYRKWRIARVSRKMESLREEYKWAYEHRDVLGDSDYETFTDIIAGELVRKEKTLSRLMRKEANG